VVTLQEVYRVEAFLTFDVYQVVEIPAYEIVEPKDRADGRVSGIIAILSADNKLLEIE
jgi:hypothetical protein